MAIRVPNLGLGDGKTGDTELKIRQDYNHNFNDQSNAASRLVGPESGNVMEVGAFGLGSIGGGQAVVDASNIKTTNNSFCSVSRLIGNGLPDTGYNYSGILRRNASGGTVLTLPYPDASVVNSMGYHFVTFNLAGAVLQVAKIYTDKNTTKDSNGFLKGASPIVDLYSDNVELNSDAASQNITFEKLGVGDYLVKGSLGFAQEGWYIETPKDANGNVLVAVVYEQLANNDISIKTYANKFDDETGDIVANLLKPRDIPVGRFISLRLHELPKEPPTMPTETQPEV